MAYGLPLISTIGDGTIADLLVENQNGYFLNDSPDLENIYSTFKRALLNNKQQLYEMGQISRQIVSEKASLQKMVSGFESAILYLVNR
jgi:hypothetical protein